MPLGRLDDVRPSSVRLPRLSISPFVFGVGGDVTASVASREVDQVFWTSLETLRDPSIRSSISIPLPGGNAKFPSFNVHGEHVWGLTYRILEQFLEVYPDGELDRTAER